MVQEFSPAKKTCNALAETYNYIGRLHTFTQSKTLSNRLVAEITPFSICWSFLHHGKTIFFPVRIVIAILCQSAEIDMVIPLGWVKERRYADVEMQIRAIKNACDGRLLKVIIETCLLTDEEKIAMCYAVSNAEADYIKTSTGFSTGGATREDVALMVKHVAPTVKVKAAGGIRTLQDAEDFLNLGASRLGTSAVVRLVKELEGKA